MHVDERPGLLPGTSDPVAPDSLRLPEYSSPALPGQRGLHVALTGTDGAGKSTQAGLLARGITDAGNQTYVTEGKDDFNGEVLRRWSAVTGQQLSPDFMHAVWALDVLKDISRNAHPMLLAGIHVVSPRSIYCQIAIARALGLETSEKLATLLTLYGEPDLTIMLDVPVPVTIARVRKRGTDDEDPTVMARFREQLHLLAEERQAMVVIDGSGTVAEVQRLVWQTYEGFLAQRRAAS